MEEILINTVAHAYVRCMTPLVEIIEKGGKVSINEVNEAYEECIRAAYAVVPVQTFLASGGLAYLPRADSDVARFVRRVISSNALLTMRDNVVRTAEELVGALRLENSPDWVKNEALQQAAENLLRELGRVRFFNREKMPHPALEDLWQALNRTLAEAVRR